MDFDAQIDSLSIRLAVAAPPTRRQSRNLLVHTPKRHSARVEKPRSVHQSPRVPERRRTFSSTKQYGTLEDHYRKMYGDPTPSETEPENDLSNMNRPVSWHPSSSRFSGFSYQTSQGSASTSSHNLVIPQDSPTFSTGPQNADTYVYSPSTLSTGAPYQSTTSLSSPSVIGQGQMSQEEVMWSSYIGTSMPAASGPPSYGTTVNEPTSWLLSDYSHQCTEPPQYQHQSAPVNFLPIQHPASQQNELTEDDGNELERQDSNVLVGMGLYDPPGSSSFGFGREGKCLKLEEEWEPPELHEDDDDDDDDDDEQNDADQESSEEEEEETPEPPKVPEKPWAPAMQPNMVPPASNMAGQSFFFEDDDTITSEWWYQQLKQPTMQGSGIGYGWLQNV